MRLESETAAGMFRRSLAILLSAFVLLSAEARAATVTGTSIPFQYVHNGIFVDVYIKGAGPFSFLIDTDTTPSAIDLSLADKLGMRHGRGGSVTGVGSGHLAAYPTTIQDLRLGDVSVNSISALAADLSALSTYVGKHIDGVLGTSFLNGRILQINYGCRTVTFPSDASTGSVTAKFRWSSSGGNLIDDVWVGSQRVLATFDSGNGTAAVITGNGIKDLHLEDAARSGTAATATGFRGQVPAAMGKVENVRLGSVMLGSLKAKFVPSMADQFEVNIGNPALARYVVTMDYKHGLLTLSDPAPCASGS